MSAYQYTAVSLEGRIVRGKIRAPNELEVEKRLEKLGYEPIKVRVCADRKRLQNNTKMRHEVLQFTIQLEQLIRAGVPLLDCINDLRDSTELPVFSEILSNIKEAVEGGKSLSEALSEYPLVFDHIYIMLIRVGERSGALAQVLSDLSDALKWQEEINAQAKRVVLYPAFVGCAVVSVIVFLMTFLLPKLLPFISEMGGEVPLHTQVLIACSHFFIHYSWVLAVFMIVVVCGLRWSMPRNQELCLKIDRLKLRMPLLGELHLMMNLSRLSNYFSLLYASGISVLEALQLCEDLMNNQAVKQAIADARVRIEEGGKLSDSFLEAGIFPLMVVRMLRVGENTGQLDQALNHVTQYYNQEVKQTIEKLIPLMEPVLTVVLGLLMAWIMVAVLGPVYDTLSHF